MKAVIICDDFAFAATANATLRRVAYRAGVSVRGTIKCWPVNALNETTLSAMKRLSHNWQLFHECPS